MCTVPPPPPPPLTPLPNLMPNPSTNQINQVFFPDNLCTWALQYPELREACIKSNICMHEPPYKYRYKQFVSIQQEGPTCGLVALSMLLNGDIHPTEILNIARKEGFSSRGEMFSCKNMVSLAEKVFSLADMDSVKLSSYNGNLYSEEVVNKVLDGSMLLVPYNADINYEPCQDYGYRAHWAIVCGVIIVKKPASIFLHPSNMFVLCKQGKSKKLMVCSFRQLFKSNSKLTEFLPKPVNGPMYVLPDGGITGMNGLKDQYVIVDGYDADFNHSPCLKLGHKAHWALVCGIMVINPDNTSQQDNIYVLCKHGKSRFLAVWKLNDLMKSNSNLVEFSPKREEEDELYILPEEGIGGRNGLKDQFVIIDGLFKNVGK